MKRSQTAKLIQELNMTKIPDIKQNYTQLDILYGLERHTIVKYHKEGGKAIISRNRPRYLKPYLDEIEQLMATSHPTKKAAFEYFRKKYGEGDI